MSDDMMIAVDPHKASNTAAVLEPVSKTLIDSARFANSADGYEQLTAFARRWAQRRWAVEGCHGAGRSLAQRLAADGELVLEPPRGRKWPSSRPERTGRKPGGPRGLSHQAMRICTPARSRHRSSFTRTPS